MDPFLLQEWWVGHTATRAAILEAEKKIFAAKGFGAVSIATLTTGWRGAAGLRAVRMKQKGAGGKMTAEQMNALVESAKKKGEWLVFMIHGMARGYDAWENPEELAKHLAWVKEQKDVEVLSFSAAAKVRGYR